MPVYLTYAALDVPAPLRTPPLRPPFDDGVCNGIIGHHHSIYSHPSKGYMSASSSAPLSLGVFRCCRGQSGRGRQEAPERKGVGHLLRDALRRRGRRADRLLLQGTQHRVVVAWLPEGAAGGSPRRPTATRGSAAGSWSPAAAPAAAGGGARTGRAPSAGARS